MTIRDAVSAYIGYRRATLHARSPAKGERYREWAEVRSSPWVTTNRFAMLNRIKATANFGPVCQKNL